MNTRVACAAKIRKAQQETLDHHYQCHICVIGSLRAITAQTILSKPLIASTQFHNSRIGSCRANAVPQLTQ